MRWERFYIVYALIFFSTLVALAYEWEVLYWISKPAIMISLIFFFHRHDRTLQVFSIALIAALAGDVLLIFEHEAAFLLGLASFLIMQVIYAYCFFRQRKDVRIRPMQGWIMLSAVAYATWIFLQISPDLNGLTVPVIIYMISILVMFLSALLRRSASRESHWKVSAGALFFLISDSLLAIDKFSQPLASGGIWIMGTYMIAQYLIVTGYSGSGASHFRIRAEP
jgi:uncharacterized membrane protein YhhN